MIGKLKGLIDSIAEDHAIIDVGGVGYVVFACGRTLGALPVGQPASIVIETQVREDHIHLFGFESEAEREWFRALTSVQRVGAKMALAILNALSPEKLLHAILAKDTRAFSAVSGVGPKLAERIVTELKDRAAALPTSNFTVNIPAATRAAKPGSDATLQDAISALTHLGYGRSEAYAAASTVLTAHENTPLDQLIRLSLKELAPA